MVNSILDLLSGLATGLFLPNLRQYSLTMTPIWSTLVKDSVSTPDICEQITLAGKDQWYLPKYPNYNDNMPAQERKRTRSNNTTSRGPTGAEVARGKHQHQNQEQQETERSKRNIYQYSQLNDNCLVQWRLERTTYKITTKTTTTTTTIERMHFLQDRYEHKHGTRYHQGLQSTEDVSWWPSILGQPTNEPTKMGRPNRYAKGPPNNLQVYIWLRSTLSQSQTPWIEKATNHMHLQRKEEIHKLKIWLSASTADNHLDPRLPSDPNNLHHIYK